MISSNIKNLREEKHITQQQLANEVHVTQQAVNRWETGAALPQSDRLREIAQAFTVPVEAIMFENGSNRKFLVPLDCTSELGNHIRELQTRCASSNCTYKDKVDLIFSQSIYKRHKRESGRYIIHVLMNEYEFRLWSAIRYYSPDYPMNDFLTLIEKESVRKCRKNNNN